MIETHLDACRSVLTRLKVCERVLFLGEDNPQSAEPEHALYPLPEGCAGNRLCDDILGVSRQTYLSTWRTNLCVGKWSAKAARKRAAELLQPTAPWHAIVALGRKVSDILAEHTEHDRLDPFWCCAIPVGSDEHGEVVMTTVVVLPHPSGRNLVWNDPRCAEKTRDLLRAVVPEYPWGEALS